MARLETTLCLMCYKLVSKPDNMDETVLHTRFEMLNLRETNAFSSFLRCKGSVLHIMVLSVIWKHFCEQTH